MSGTYIEKPRRRSSRCIRCLSVPTNEGENVTQSYWSRVQNLTLDMPPKSIFRQPGAQHFQVVHRSQRDPLINDPDASQHVLKPVVRENAKKVILLHTNRLFQLVTPSTRASRE